MAIGFERFPGPRPRAGPRPGPRPGPRRGSGRGGFYPGTYYGGSDFDRYLDIEVVPAPAPALPWRVLLDRRGLPAVYGSTLSEALQRAGSQAPGVRVLRAQRWDGFSWRDA